MNSSKEKMIYYNIENWISDDKNERQDSILVPYVQLDI
jgi:hypothetical protein